VPRSLKLFEAERLVEIDRFLRKGSLLLRLLEVEMLSVKEALLLMFEQDRLHRKKIFFFFWGGGVIEP